MRFAKGHGTENDFVLLPDLAAELELTPSAVAVLCDRRRGLGADGILRVTTVGAARQAGVFETLVGSQEVADDTWYMDYRNADGSIAQMCGNGVRVFAHYLWATELERRTEFVVATLAGPRAVTINAASAVQAEVTVDMGRATVLGTGSATVGGRAFMGIGVDVGNPHLACVDPRLDAEILGQLDVSGPVQFDRAQFPDGVNIEVVTAAETGADGDFVRMRVHERGVGETRSCGTGTVAAAVAALRHRDSETGSLAVVVPGGRVQVQITETSSYLRGPSVLVAHGELTQLCL